MSSLPYGTQDTLIEKPLLYLAAYISGTLPGPTLRAGLMLKHLDSFLTVPGVVQLSSI